MTVKPRRPVGGLPGPEQLSGDHTIAKKPVGRPKGAPSTIVNVRLPLTLVVQLDRYLDHLDTMLARWFPKRAAVGKLLFHKRSIDHHGGESP